jgi:peptide-methionine (S)-S-oxide reductase
LKGVTVFTFRNKPEMVSEADALPGRDTPVPVAPAHVVLGTPLQGPWPDGLEVAVVGMGCFWGVERIYWQTPGVYSTAAGYAGGYTPNPTYEETCTGRTGHTEAVQIVFDPAVISYEEILKIMWENHDPTQQYGQGNDVGTQYRSAIYTTGPEQARVAELSRDVFQRVLTDAGHGPITTEIAPLRHFYYAEDYHQQYLSDSKNPNGYCNHGPNGLSCPVGIAKAGS